MNYNLPDKKRVYYKVYIFILFISIFLLGSCINMNPIVEWENGIVPYFLSGSFSSSDIDDIDRAMETWEEACGVLFQKVSPRSYAYEIRRITVNQWSSSIGENNVFNFMTFDSGTPKYGHIVHELGHCIGPLHEHQRPDRDEHMNVYYQNIYPEYRHNFDKRDNPLIIESNYDYDCNSIMHYYEDAFTMNGEDTIKVTDSENCPNLIVERGQGLTQIDEQKCKDIYGEVKDPRDWLDYY